MKLIELSQTRVTFAPLKKRKVNGLWDLDKYPNLKLAVEQCAESGKESYVMSYDHMLLFHITPKFPFIESAMAQPENAKFLKVSVSAFASAFYLGVQRADSSQGVGR